MSDTTPTSATPVTTPPVTPDPELDGLGDKGKETLRKEREARKAEETARIAAETELKTLRDAEAKRQKEAQAAAEAKAIEDKKFEELAEKRGQDLTTITGERDALTTKIADYEKVIGPIVEERLKPFEALNDKDLMADFPKDADGLTKLAWLNDPWKQRAVKDIEAKADNLRRFPQTPRPNATVTPTDDEARQAQSRMYRDF